MHSSNDSNKVNFEHCICVERLVRPLLKNGDHWCGGNGQEEISDDVNDGTGLMTTSRVCSMFNF